MLRFRKDENPELERFLMKKEKLMQMRRAGGEKEIKILSGCLFVGTAAAFAAAASDLVDEALASALGNFGLLGILIRVYFFTPQIVAQAKQGDANWLEAEVRYARERYPWANLVGKAGWTLLLAGVCAQVFLGIS